MKRYIQKGFTLVEVFIVVVVVGLLSGAGYYIYNNQHKTKNNTASQTPASTNNSSKTTASSSQKPLEISELGLKINDPENRGLSYAKVNTCEVECSDVNMVRDNNDEYFNACEYPASISVLTESEAQFDIGHKTYFATKVKKINGKWFEITNGTHYQAACRPDKDANSLDAMYEDSLRQYLADNLAAL